jgi:hypothetical protein
MRPAMGTAQQGIQILGEQAAWNIERRSYNAKKSLIQGSLDKLASRDLISSPNTEKPWGVSTKGQTCRCGEAVELNEREANKQKKSGNAYKIPKSPCCALQWMLFESVPGPVSSGLIGRMGRNGKREQILQVKSSCGDVGLRIPVILWLRLSGISCMARERQVQERDGISSCER